MEWMNFDTLPGQFEDWNTLYLVHEEYDVNMTREVYIHYCLFSWDTDTFYNAYGDEFNKAKLGDFGRRHNVKLYWCKADCPDRTDVAQFIFDTLYDDHVEPWWNEDEAEYEYWQNREEYLREREAVERYYG